MYQPKSYNHPVAQRNKPTTQKYPRPQTDDLHITIETQVSSYNSPRHSPRHSPVNNERRAQAERYKKNREAKDTQKYTSRNNEPYLKGYHVPNSIQPISISTMVKQNPHGNNHQLNYSAKINSNYHEHSGLYSFQVNYNTQSPNAQISYSHQQEQYRSLKPKHVIKITDHQRASSPITLKRDQYDNTSLSNSIEKNNRLEKQKNFYSNIKSFKDNQVSANQKFGKSDMKQTAYQSERYPENEEDFEDLQKSSNGVKKRQVHFAQSSQNNHKKRNNFQYQSLLTPPPKSSLTGKVSQLSQMPATPKNVNKNQSSSQANTHFKSKIQFSSPRQEKIDQNISITHQNQDQQTKNNSFSNKYEILIEDSFDEGNQREETIWAQRRQPPSPTIYKDSERNKKMSEAMNKTATISFKDHASNTTIVVPLSRTESRLKDNQESRQGLNKTFNHTHHINISKRGSKGQLQHSRFQQSKTLSRSKYSISPQCQIITDRLHNSKINKLPCPRYAKYKQAMRRIKVTDGIQDYTFIRRYLSDDQIYDIMEELHQANVPQKKWPNKLVDIVYDKLRKGKI